jgi:hypothetical protein
VFDMASFGLFQVELVDPLSYNGKWDWLKCFVKVLV